MNFSKDWRDKLFSVFVGNIHPLSSVGSIWKKFSVFGVVVDVFVPFKSYASKTKIAFVRFKSGAEATRAIEDSKDLFLDGNLLSIREAHVRKHKDKSRLFNEGVGGGGSVDFKSIVGRTFKDALLSEKVRSLPSYDLQSGSEKKNFCDGKKSIAEEKVNIPREVNDWLLRSAVGKLRNAVKPQVIQDYFSQEGVSVSVVPWSNSNLLLSFVDSKDRDLLLIHYADILSSWFEEVIPWGAVGVQRSSSLWVKIEGVPLVLWHENFFSWLGSQWGKVTFIADVTLERRNLEGAWLRVEVDDNCNIPKEFSSMVNGVICNLKCSVVPLSSIPCYNPFTFSSLASNLCQDSPVFILEEVGGAQEFASRRQSGGLGGGKPNGYLQMSMEDGPFRTEGTTDLPNQIVSNSNCDSRRAVDFSVGPTCVDVNHNQEGYVGVDKEIWAIQVAQPISGSVYNATEILKSDVGACSNDVSLPQSPVTMRTEPILGVDSFAQEPVLIVSSKKVRCVPTHRIGKTNRGKKIRNYKRKKGRKFKRVFSDLLEDSGVENDFDNDFVRMEDQIEESLQGSKINSSVMNLPVESSIDGGLTIDLSDYGIGPSFAGSPSPAKRVNVFQSDEKLGVSKGFGGFNKGFLDLGSKHSWNWFRKPRARRYQKSPSDAGDPKVSDGSYDANYMSVRKEAEDSLAVGKLVGISFVEDEETVVQALMTID